MNAKLVELRQAIEYSNSEPYVHDGILITSCFFEEVEHVRAMIGHAPSIIMVYAEPDILQIPELVKVIVKREKFDTSLTFLTNWELDGADKMIYRGQTILSSRRHALKAGSTASNIDLLISTRDVPFEAVRYALMASQMNARQLLTETLDHTERGLHNFLNRGRLKR